MIPFLNSLLIATGTVICSLILGLPLAIFLVKTDLPFKKWLKYLYLIPIFIPPSIMALTWISLGGSMKWLFSPFGAIALLTLCFFPFITLLSSGGLSAVGRDLEEAARLDYAEMGVLRHITLPYAFGYILAGALFVFVFAISNYEIPALLGINTFPVEIFAQFSGYYNPQKAFLLSLPLVGLTTLLIIIAGRTLQGRDYVAIGQTWSKPRIIKLSSKVKVAALGFIATLLGASVIFPFSVLARRAEGFAVYLKAIKLSWHELNFSLFWAILGTILVVVFSFFIAYIIERSKTKFRHLLYYASILPFAVPATVLGIVLIKLFNREALNFVYTTPIILLIGYFFRFSPFAIRILSASIAHIDKDLESEAKLCGAGFFRRIFIIVAPLCRPGLVISLAIVFALIMGELGMTILVVPAGASTLILKIYTLMHYGAGKLVAALALISVMVILILIGLLLSFNKWFKKASLTTIASLIILQAAYGGCFAQGAGSHLYSTWETIELDTCASAWLIKNFVDEQAKFKFYPKGELVEQGVAFDTPDAKFKRSHNVSCFGSILNEYKIEDKTLLGIGNIIHDIEINYWMGSIDPQAEELNKKVLKVIDESSSPVETIINSFPIFDELYEQLKQGI